ncbi:MAG: hypothetical protein HQL66_01910 [Magnetococcales bacterium]|nr:hypothetical protein [Magnetococcales bacterium]
MLWDLTFLINLIFLLGLIWWRGLLTTEGLGMAMLTLLFVSDGLGLYVLALTGMDIDYERELRLLPNLVQLLGLLAFAGGLFVTDPSARRLEYNVNLADNPSLRRTVISVSYFLVFMGISMKIYALISWGFTSLDEYLSGMYMYQATKEGGGFMDSGLEIACLGLGLLVAVHGESRAKQFFAITALITLTLIFSFSKSGIHYIVILLATVLYFFNRDLLKSYMKVRYAILVILLLVLSLGIKTQLKYGRGAEVKLESDEVLTLAAATSGRRYGPFSAYRGYCFLVNRMYNNPSLYFGDQVIIHTLTGWIPRFLWPDKPGHPFHARGDLVDELYLIDRFGNDAPTFAGMAYADAGLASLLVYMSVGGIILGLIRQFVVATRRRRFLSTLWYVFFAISFGPGMEASGMMNLLYYFVFASILVLVVYLFLGMRSILWHAFSVDEPAQKPDNDRIPTRLIGQAT